VTSSPLDVLFRPLTIGGLELPNRIVMAPMTRGFAPEGVPGEAQAAYYRRRAEGGVGLILSEGTVVDRPASRNMAGIPLFHGDLPLAGWKQVIEAVHAAGGRMGPQIWHTGSTVGPDGWTPDAPVESPSGLLAPATPRGEAMSEEAIADTVDAFGRAAADAKRLGFDTVELHGAHGYLIDQFFWHGTNRRQDEWGGAALADRGRFAVEVVRACRRAVGPDFPILFRFSQWKQQDYAAKLATTPGELASLLEPLADAGVDIFHASQRRFWEPEFADSPLNLAGWARKLTGRPSITVGSLGIEKEMLDTMFSGSKAAPSLGRLEALNIMLERGDFDLVAIGRALLVDPNWVDKVRRSAHDELQPYSPASLATLS
jgi:2,4-dienoyl-CoA reductase-like NADH-dependent reductase (Old Yellow Enzyme family)